MRSLTSLTFVVGLAFAAVFAASPARAVALNHTWVSSTGTDGSSCGSDTSPCATFAGALANTNGSGEISCLTSGDFNAGYTLIQKPITINCEGVVGANIGYVVVNLPSTGNVVLRGLEINGSSLSFPTCFGGTADAGLVTFFGAATLHLEKMKIGNLVGAGCGVLFEGLGSGPSVLDVTDCDITDIGSGTGTGIYITGLNNAANVSFSINNSRIVNNVFGVVVDGTASATVNGAIKNSVVSGNNTGNGITLSNSGGPSDQVLVEETTVLNNFHGLVARGSTANILVRNSSVTANALGLYTVNSGTLSSYGNNSVNNNTTDGAFTGTVGLK